MFEVTIDLSQLESFQQALVELPNKVESVLLETMQEAEKLGHEALNEHPAKIPFPGGKNEDPRYNNTNVKWDTLKQRVWYNHNMPMPYSGEGALFSALEESTPTASSGLIEGKVYAIEDWVKYVIGSGKQSDIHKLRDEPWQTDEQVAQRITPEVVKLFSDALARSVVEALNTK